MTEREVAEYKPEHTLDFYVEARNGHKRNYVFDYGKSRSCDHPSLKVVARGDIDYICTECNYVFAITGAYQRPRHHTVIASMFKIMGFAKDFGNDSLMEVLRRPIGQQDGSPHKAVLPEGKSFMDVLAEVEDVDTTTPDGGQEQLQLLIEGMWEGKAPQLKEGVRDDENKALGEADGESPALPHMQVS